ncbi:MAG: DNA replication protein [Alphaproteobacteria bacterium]|nr:MAG: DNA replication protein [Alphaproteobacteria bacterium]
MASKPSQIPIAFPVNTSYSREDFMPAPCNLEALAWVDRWPEWNYPALILHGQTGCGKTHLLSLWQAKAGNTHIAIDNAQDIFGDKEAEKELFHQFNISKENNTSILLTLSKPVAQYDITLPDLASRLRAAPSAEVQEPDDIALQGVFLKLCHDRQLTVTPEVIAYILPRIERSYGFIRHLVTKIDEASLSEKRAVTVPLARDVLESIENSSH